jgi:hypothetical protein
MNAIRDAIGEAMHDPQSVPVEIQNDYRRVVALEHRPAALAETSSLAHCALEAPKEFKISPQQAIILVTNAREKIYERWYTQVNTQFEQLGIDPISPSTQYEPKSHSSKMERAA